MIVTPSCHPHSPFRHPHEGEDPRNVQRKTVGFGTIFSNQKTLFLKMGPCLRGDDDLGSTPFLQGALA